MNHLVLLSTLHAAAPGVLDVVFGPDGDFEGAPKWEAQLWHHPLESYRTVSARRWDPEGIMLDLSFDLRSPTVAARLAGLCARALGCPADAAFMSDTGTPEQGFIAFRVEWALISGRRWIWNRGTGAELSERPAGVCLPPRCGAASGLAALALALAPKIAALKS